MCVNVCIESVVYTIKIITNSRKIDGHYRSWIDFLNERYNACKRDRSIKRDT